MMRKVKTNLPEYLVRVALNRGHMYTDKETSRELDRLFEEYTKEELWEYAKYEGNDYVEVENDMCGTVYSHIFMRRKDITTQKIKEYK